MVVVVFSIDGCPFCEKAKAALHNLEVPFEEINLSHYPEKRAHMVKMSNALSVPQIFLNGAPLGGADDLSKLIDSGDFVSMWEKAKSETPCTAEELKLPDYQPKPYPQASDRSSEVFGPESKQLKAHQVLQLLESNIGSKRFSGQKLIRHIKVIFELSDKAQAEKHATELLHAGLVVRLNFDVENDTSSDKEPTKVEADQTSYCLVADRMPAAMNMNRLWRDRVDDGLVVVRALKKQLEQILGSYRNADGLVNYSDAYADPRFAVFDEATCELQAISLHDMKPEVRKAFLINVYNLLTLHAFTKVGIPTSDLARLSFFDNVGYVLGNRFYSFNAIENGLLRGNKIPPYHLFPTIRKNDSERAANILPLDCRIHAALNCGAKSCPPIKTFTAEAIEEELDVVARAFFEQDSNCAVNPEQKTVCLTQIVKWYCSDFGANNREIVSTIASFVSGERAEHLKAILQAKSFKLKYLPYDWSTDACNSAVYKTSCVTGCSLL